MVSRKGARTFSVGVTEPTGADSIPHLQIRDRSAEADDPSLDFVTTHEGEFGHSPVIVPHVVITVADPAVGDLDLDLVVLQRSELELVGLELRTGFQSGPGVDDGRIGHGEGSEN